MPSAADYKLHELLGVAGATIGIIIAGGVILGYLGAKYIALFERYRALTGEYRDNHASDPRRGSLQNQISCYRQQVALLNYSSLFVALALVAFVATVETASLSVIYPEVMMLRLVGTITLFTGLSFICLGMVLEVAELWVARKTIGKEVSDFSDLPSTQEAVNS